MSSVTEAEVEASTAEQTIELEREYLLQNYGRYPIVLQRGRGAYVYDVQGKRYLDFISGIGVNALGYAHPRITKIIREQAAKLIHTSNLYYHEFQGPLAKKLAETSGLQRSFFCNSGTEATEGAMKMIRSHGTHIDPSKYEIIALENSFHGRTLGSLSITGQHKYRKDFEPLLPGVRFVNGHDPSSLEAVFCDKTAGILIETIQGEGGIIPISSEFARRARELCDKYDALLVFDEIQCGVGRPGVHYAFQLFDPPITPDIVVLAKPISCGIPLGAVICNERAAASIAPGMHGSTFGGNALACRVSLEFYDILDELLPSIRSQGTYFQMKLQEFAKKYSFVKEVRGVGLMIGVELTSPCKQLVVDAMNEGLLLNCTHETVLRFLPPYIVTKKEIDAAVRILAKLFKQFRPEGQQ